MYNNAYNKIHTNRNIIVTDSFIFRVNSKREYFKNEFLEGHLMNGCHIVKRNLKTGALIWQTDYNDLQAGRQEMPIISRINENNNIEIYGYRRARTTESNNFQFGAFGLNDRDLRLFFREYDGETGTLLRHDYPRSEDTTAAVLKDYFPSFFTKLFFTPNDTTIRYFETLIEHPGPKGIITYLLNRSGKRISKIDTISTHVTQQHSHVFLTKKNQYLVAINNIYDGDKILLHYYDLNMNWLRTKEVIIKSHKGRLFVNSYKNSKFLELLIYNNDTPPTYHEETFALFLDWDGNVVDSIYTNFRLSSFVYNEEQNFFVNERTWDEQINNYRFNFLIRMKNDSLKLFKTYKATDSYHCFPFTVEFLNEYMLFHTVERHLDYDHYDASTYILVKLKDFGLTLSSNKEVSHVVDWTIYPNPASDFINIAFEQNQTGTLTILDMTGRLITSQRLHNESWITLDTSPWLPGMYLVQYVDDKGSVVTKKMMKQ